MHLRPVANGADWRALAAQKKAGRYLHPRRALRHRPPPPLRAVSSGKPVWDELNFTVTRDNHLRQSAEPSVPRQPFSKLYRILQKRQLARFGVHGPIALLGAMSFALFIAYAASSQPRIVFPAA